MGLVLRRNKSHHLLNEMTVKFRTSLIFTLTLTLGVINRFISLWVPKIKTKFQSSILIFFPPQMSTSDSSLCPVILSTQSCFVLSSRVHLFPFCLCISFHPIFVLSPPLENTLESSSLDNSLPFTAARAMTTRRPALIQPMQTVWALESLILEAKYDERGLNWFWIDG